MKTPVLPNMMPKLQKLFEDELRNIFSAEIALLNTMSKMMEDASSRSLKSALLEHLFETKGQVSRIERIFAQLGKRPMIGICEAIERLISDANQMMAYSDPGAIKDAGIIIIAQKIEHYEIASYGTLRNFAFTLGFKEAESMLEETLSEEKAADQKLTEIAVSEVNVDAAIELEEVAN
ncbi:MAG TPA: ferritin-like domain-containing protein [Puia sp.]|nr:ferritin-like domain-containing protein [Puia sp.]